MAANKHDTKAAREEHLGKVSEMFCQGVRQHDIAARLGVAPSQITYDLRILMARWAKASTAKIDEFKSSELERINNLERTYWQAWLDSCEAGVKVSKEKRVGAEVVTNRQEVDKPAGNPTFLAGVQWCIDRRCKLMGLDAAVKLAGADGGALIPQNEYTDIERAAMVAALYERLSAAAQRRDDNGADQPV